MFTRQLIQNDQQGRLLFSSDLYGDKLTMTKPWHYLSRWVMYPFGTRRIIVGVTLIWLITGPMFHSRRWLWLLSTGTAIVTLVMLFLIVTEHYRQAKMLSERLNQLDDSLKKDEQTVLRKLHAKHRNGEDS